MAGGSRLACGSDERLELRTGAMSLSEDGLASTWDYAINNPLLTQQAWIPALAPRLLPIIGSNWAGSCAGALLCHSRRPTECYLGGDMLPASKAS